MAYGVITEVDAPAETYDQVHAEVVRRAGPNSPGLLLHVGRATDQGFQVIEVWESKEHFAAFNRDVMHPLMMELAGDAPPPAPPQIEEFEPRGLVIPSAELWH